jgi:hypothetical protein
MDAFLALLRQKPGFPLQFLENACGGTAGFPISKSTLWICDQSLARGQPFVVQRRSVAVLSLPINSG